MMPQLQRLILHPLAGKIFLCVLASVYLVYLLAGVRLLSTSRPAPAESISEHAVETNADAVSASRVRRVIALAPQEAEPPSSRDRLH